MDVNGTLYSWFADTVRRHPGADAIEVSGIRVTYAQLHDLVDRVAARLVSTVGGRPAAVGLLASRSLAAYTGYLAALRLGAVVVPLNPSFPTERNRTMCESAGVGVIVADESGEHIDLPVSRVSLLGDWRDALPEPWQQPYGGDPDDVAYMLFTSGSTGKPKGVPIRHRHLHEYLRYCVNRYEAGVGSRLSQVFDLTFDVSVFDLFVSWCSGATLVVPQPNDILTPVRFVREARLTHWFSVPSVVSVARRLRTLRPDSMPGLRWSLFAGEQLTLQQARSWAIAAPDAVLENVYGPTELTITCTAYRLPATLDEWPETSNGTVPIGDPLPHLQGVLLTDEGAADDDGELCIRGSQRFDGYLDPAHDPGRFLKYEGENATVTDGSPAPDDWYRTGDRVRVENGVWVHIGRLDDQVKVRGYRIELGEIECVLRDHPSIHDVVVLALPMDNESMGLYALYTGEQTPPAELTELTSSRLPSYMVPQRYTHIDHMPVNANGKIDRRRLAEEVSLP